MLIPIGRFARAARVSIKSLRRYDEAGLLPAAFVDPQSRYRYDRIEQLARAETIRFLRIVDMPLPAIAETLDGDDPESLLEAHLESMERRRDEIERLAIQLRQRIDRKDYLMSADVTIKTTPSITAVAYRTETSYPAIFDDIPAGFDEVMEYLAEAGVDPIGAPSTVYHKVTFCTLFGDVFTYEKDRALLFRVDESLPTNELRECVAMALTYHLPKARRLTPRKHASQAIPDSIGPAGAISAGYPQ